MNEPKSRGRRIAIGTAAALVLVLMGAVIGGLLGNGLQLTGIRDERTAVEPQSAVTMDDAGLQGAPAGAGAAESGPPAATEQKAASSAQAQPMVVKTATMDVRVDDVAEAVTAIRADVVRFGAQVTDYSISSGDIGSPVDARVAASGPTTAYMTLRVPADKLDALRRQVSKVGVVLSESSAASDVTQQYVDMSARLKNLKAEEVRLRQFLDKTDKVSELLQVESELSRVRGEIESMQAQLDYLKDQVALSTLTVTLSEPGAIVEPSGADWGFRDALTRGIRGAAAVTTLLITAVIALAPLALLVFGIVVVTRAVVARRRRTAHAAAQTESARQDTEA